MERPIMFYVNSDCVGVDLNVNPISKITYDGTDHYVVLSDGDSYKVNEPINDFYVRINDLLYRAGVAPMVF